MSPPIWPLCAPYWRVFPACRYGFISSAPMSCGTAIRCSDLDLSTYRSKAEDENEAPYLFGNQVYSDWWYV